MKKILFAFLAVLVLSIGCTESTLEPVDSPSGRRTSNPDPNVFCGVGTLSVPNSITNQAVGTQLELWAGAGNRESAILVGYVYFTVSGSNLHVKYAFNDADGNGQADMFPWIPVSIHFDIGDNLSDIPTTRSGNPVPGQFDYNFTLSEPYSVNYEFDVVLPADLNGDGQYFVAAHAAVEKFGGIEGFNFYLPNNQVTLRIVDYPSAGDPSYFRLKVTNGGFISNYDMGYGAGIYEGWCVDVDHTIALNTNYPAYLYSSYDYGTPAWDLPEGLIEKPYNFDLVNWLVNNFSSGQTITFQKVNANCVPQFNSLGQPIMITRTLTYGDLQRTIWMLIDDNLSTSGLGNWSADAANYLYCQAMASGEGFTPSCNQKIVFLVIPKNNMTPPTSNDIQVVIGQPVIGEIQVPCETQGETAWADGRYGANFPGANQWGTYFMYKPTCL